MKRMITGILMVLFTFSLHAGDPAAEARQAEIDFAKAFADRDIDRFFDFVLDDAHFLGPKNTLSGRAKVREGWSAFFEGAAPFSWAPDRVVANAAGDLALSTGPIRDPEGKLIGYYSSVWRKGADGKWKVAFDGPGSALPCPPASAGSD